METSRSLTAENYKSIFDLCRAGIQNPDTPELVSLKINELMRQIVDTGLADQAEFRATYNRMYVAAGIQEAEDYANNVGRHKALSDEEPGL